MITVRNLFACLGLLTIIFGLQAQNPDNWYSLDPQQDKVNGIRSELTLQTLLKDKAASEVIVAVIDGGVDPKHEDLKSVMWVNEDEVADNGIDDDQNGYVDDIYGWNFIGGTDGKNVHHDTYELTRIYKKMDEKYNDANPLELEGEKKKEYALYLSYKKDVENAYEKASEKLNEYSQILAFLNFALDQAADLLGDKSLNQVDLDSISDQYMMVKNLLSELLPQVQPFEGSVTDLKDMVVKDFEDAVEHERSKVEYGYNKDFNPRTIVKDNYENLAEKNYGNNDVKGPDAFHGSHVAGIIAADRKNGLGIRGVAPHVKIMAIRAVPDGDERDKDVANAIHYAVDNGAKIINMSFGKGFSPHEGIVEEAIRYAQKHDVLLVHAAGNNNQDNDVENNYPNQTFDLKKGLFQSKYAKTWIEVGALTSSLDESAVATFSNYGQTSVDLFAPGQDILSTTPDGNYESTSGTSMAAPVVSGVAAILRSYFPQLSAKKIRKIILKNCREFNREVYKPGTSDLVPFNSLSSTGGIIDTYRAVQSAMGLKPDINPAPPQKKEGPRA